MRVKLMGLCVCLLLLCISVQAKNCQGHFVNPLKDVCWKCLFPLSIGHTNIVSSHLGDTENAKLPIGKCPSKKFGWRIGLNIGYWEPIALTDVTDTPYCMVNLGGHVLNLGSKTRRGGASTREQGLVGAYFDVHWYTYPLISWLNIITSAGCEGEIGLDGKKRDFDVLWLTELDPTWHDSEMGFVMNPEAALFGNPVAGAACAADSLSATTANKPVDTLFWCAGSQGSHYPLSGHVNAPVSPVQTALLLTERMNFKLHRLLQVTDSSADKKGICDVHRYPVLPKSRYRYEMVNQVADGRHCYPSGSSTLTWEAGKIKPHTQDQYGFLIWRKKNCVFL